MNFNEIRDELNRVLHHGVGLNKPFDKACEMACTHIVVTTERQGGWTALGLSNVLARRIQEVEEANEQRGPAFA